MLKEAPGPINFTVFLTMFGEKLKGKWWGEVVRIQKPCRNLNLSRKIIKASIFMLPRQATNLRPTFLTVTSSFPFLTILIFFI